MFSFGERHLVNPLFLKFIVALNLPIVSWTFLENGVVRLADKGKDVQTKCDLVRFCRNDRDMLGSWIVVVWKSCSVHLNCNIRVKRELRGRWWEQVSLDTIDRANYCTSLSMNSHNGSTFPQYLSINTHWYLRVPYVTLLE